MLLQRILLRGMLFWRRVFKSLHDGRLQKILEWSGVATAIVYSLAVALNVGLEFWGFLLLFVSAGLIGLWARLGGHRGILLLQLFYATAGVVGMVRWF